MTHIVCCWSFVGFLKFTNLSKIAAYMVHKCIFVIVWVYFVILEIFGVPKHSNPNILPIGETFGFVVLLSTVT